MKRLQGFAVINDTVGKKIAFTYSDIDVDGNILSSNIKESFVPVDQNVLDAIAVIEDVINNRITPQSTL